MREKDEIISIIKEAQRISIQSLTELLNSCELDSKSLLSTIPNIRFEKLKINAIAEFSPESNEILLKDGIIPTIVKDLRKNKEDVDKVKNHYIKEIAISIIHESIHSLRTITRKINEIDSAYLTSIILNLDSDSCLEYCDNIEEKEDVVCDIIQNHSTEEIKSLIQKGDIREVNKRIDEYQELINYQNSMEECLTEALAQITYKHLLSKKPLEEDIEDIIHDSNSRLDAIVGAKLIKHFGKKIIQWIVTTKDNNNYENLLEEEFQDNYMNLLKLVNSVYHDILNIAIIEDRKDIVLKQLDDLLESKEIHRTI